MGPSIVLHSLLVPSACGSPDLGLPSIQNHELIYFFIINYPDSGILLQYKTDGIIRGHRSSCPPLTNLGNGPGPSFLIIHYYLEMEIKVMKILGIPEILNQYTDLSDLLDDLQ